MSLSMEPVAFAHWDPSAPGELPGIGATLRQVHVKAGHSAKRHSHPYEQFLLVMSGGGQLECAAGTVDLKPGCVIHFPPGAWHSAEFTEATVLTEFNLAEVRD